MPKGDGTGPFGDGPLGRGGRNSGRGLGRRRSMNSPGTCLQDDSQAGFPYLSRNVNRADGFLQRTVMKVLGMAVIAIPALFKMRNELQAPMEKGLLERKWSKEEPPTIEVVPVLIEEKEIKK